MNSSTTEPSITLRVEGDLLCTRVDAVRQEAANLLTDSAGAKAAWQIFKLDLTAAKMVDSAGLNLVVALLKRVLAKGGTMQVLYSNENVLRTFKFTRLDEHVQLVKA